MAMVYAAKIGACEPLQNRFSFIFAMLSWRHGAASLSAGQIYLKCVILSSMMQLVFVIRKPGLILAT